VAADRLGGIESSSARVTEGRFPRTEVERGPEPETDPVWARTQAFTFGFSTLTLLVNVLTGVLIARALGTDGRGELTAILTLPATIGWIFAMGSLQAVSYHHARHPEDGGRLIASWLVMLLPLAAFAIVAGYLLLPALFAAQTHDARQLAQIYLLTIFSQLLAEVIVGVLLGDHDFFVYNLIRVAQPALALFAFLFLWWIDAFTVGSALLTTFLVSLALMTVVALRVLSRHGLARPSLSLMRSTLWYGVRAHGANVGGVVNARLDVLIIPAFIAASGVGLYAVAIAATSVIPIIAGALSPLVLPAAARQGARGVATVIRSLHATIAVALVLAAGLALLAQPAVRLVYGSEFEGSVVPLRLLLPGTVLYAGASVLWSGLYAVNRPFTATVAQVAGAVVTVAGLLLFLESGGINAAAVVTTVAYTVVFVAALVLYRRATALRLVEFLPGRIPRGGSLSAERKESLVGN
jgi:O-antigen/teichoic acid export membrane protein